MRLLYKASLALCLLALAACSDTAGSAAQAVSSARQCGVQEIAPGLLMRLSSYGSGGIPGDTIFVVELCHPERGCSAAATYENGMGPLVVARAPELVIHVPMATSLRVFRDETWIQGRRVPLRIEARAVRTEAERNAARSAFGLPPGRTSFDSCRSDLEIRPFYRDATA